MPDKSKRSSGKDVTKPVAGASAERSPSALASGRSFIVTAEDLRAAWSRYVELLGEAPHGTIAQLKALLELLPKARPLNSTSVVGRKLELTAGPFRGPKLGLPIAHRSTASTSHENSTSDTPVVPSPNTTDPPL